MLRFADPPVPSGDAHPPGLEVGGYVPFSTVDFPGCLAAVVFCQGCPWRCSYCHNAHLQPFGAGRIAWADILAKLERRRGLLDGVVFSGGEPTAQSALADAMRDVRGMGFAVGLHTAGMYPSRLAGVLPLTDWVGFDVKAPFDGRYDLLTGRSGSADLVCESLRILLASGVRHQIRTTLDTDHLDDAACEAVRAGLRSANAPPTHWQVCRKPGNTAGVSVGNPGSGSGK